MKQDSARETHDSARYGTHESAEHWSQQKIKENMGSYVVFCCIHIVQRLFAWEARV